MKNKNTKNGRSPYIDILKNWEKIWNNLDETNKLFQSYIDTTLLVHQRIKMEPLMKSFDHLKQISINFYDLLDEIIADEKANLKIEIKLPYESDKFKTEWDNWKKYLAEQHHIELSSRAENKQLEMLKQISEGYEEKAYPVLDYAIANLYKMFFQLDERKKTTKTKTKNIKNDGDY